MLFQVFLFAAATKQTHKACTSKTKLPKDAKHVGDRILNQSSKEQQAEVLLRQA